MLFQLSTFALGLVATVGATSISTRTSKISLSSTASDILAALQSGGFSLSSLNLPCKSFSSTASIPTPSIFQPYNVYKGDAPYSVAEKTLQAGISFPNGFQCRKNLVILFPGTAVPALSTFTSTFIPVFNDANNGQADVMVVTNPSVSLGDAQVTAEYAAYAINYAFFVLGRQATIIPWSQGNLNTQWALKYWPSTRYTLKNYVAMSPDYDGTLDASFLCAPEKLLTTNAASLASSFLTDNGLGTSLQSILGIKALPTTASQFKLYMLSLLSGNLQSYLSSSSSTSLTGVLTGVTSGLTSGLTSALKSGSKRAVPFGRELSDAEQQYWKRQIEERLIERAVLVDRQAGSGSTSAVNQLLSGLLGPLANDLTAALTAMQVQPTSILQEIVSNELGNLGSFKIPSALPTGCLPGVWQQVYMSNFVQTLAAPNSKYGNKRGDNVFVPTTAIFSITDEVVQPQGATGFEAASGYLIGASNILIQGNGGCPVAPVAQNSNGLPDIITHEGVLYSGMGVEAAIQSVKLGRAVTVNDIRSDYRCLQIHPVLTVTQALAQEATIPGALLRVLIGDGTATTFLPAEPTIMAYAK